MSRSNFIILVLYVDDILLASNNIDLLHESKRFLSRNFDMKYLSEALYVIGIEIQRDRANGRFRLSQKAYIKCILNKFNMQHCSPTVTPVIKGDMFGSHQCPKTKVEYEEMRRISYAFVVGSLTEELGFTDKPCRELSTVVGRPHVDHPRADKEDICDHSSSLVQLSTGCAPQCSDVEWVCKQAARRYHNARAGVMPMWHGVVRRYDTGGIGVPTTLASALSHQRALVLLEAHKEMKKLLEASDEEKPFGGELEKVWMNTENLLLSSLPRGSVRPPGNGCTNTENGGNPCIGSRKLAGRIGVVATPTQLLGNSY
ncbi:putative zinc finger, CCHC-type containing protein [Tanacetum coccineum]